MITIGDENVRNEYVNVSTLLHETMYQLYLLYAIISLSMQ